MSILNIMAKLGKKSYRCEKCQHEWTTRTERVPVQCPKCKSARFNEPREEE
jgi:predicted Zn-ribbon and HTH transcriptional regulator